jgi:hypothetical protein
LHCNFAHRPSADHPWTIRCSSTAHPLLVCCLSSAYLEPIRRLSAADLLPAKVKRIFRLSCCAFSTVPSNCGKTYSTQVLPALPPDSIGFPCVDFLHLKVGVPVGIYSNECVSQLKLQVDRGTEKSQVTRRPMFKSCLCSSSPKLYLWLDAGLPPALNGPYPN